MNAVRDAVRQACTIATHTQEDPCAGLAPAELMAGDVPDLDLNHPWDIDVDEAVASPSPARTPPAAPTRASSTPRARASAPTAGLAVYGNSHGFVGGYPSTRHGLSCAVVGKQGDSMQRDSLVDHRPRAGGPGAAASVGRRAAERTVARLGARRLSAPARCRCCFAPNSPPVCCAASPAPSAAATCIARPASCWTSSASRSSRTSCASRGAAPPARARQRPLRRRRRRHHRQGPGHRRRAPDLAARPLLRLPARPHHHRQRRRRAQPLSIEHGRRRPRRHDPQARHRALRDLADGPGRQQ
jgi:hypothetical protein